MDFIPREFSVQWNCTLFSLGMKSIAPKIPSIWRNFTKIMISLIISSIWRNFISAIVYRTLIFGLLQLIFVLYSKQYSPWDAISLHPVASCSKNIMHTTNSTIYMFLINQDSFNLWPVFSQLYQTNIILMLF